MNINMKQWVAEQISSPVKKALPVLSFPSVQLMGISVKELISDSSLQAKGMEIIADRVPSAATVSLMDLSLEAECFGAEIVISDDEVPTVIGSIVRTEEDANALTVPPVGTKRTQLYINALQQALDRITDRPVFAGVIGPFSLAGRLMDVTEIMIYCFENPEMVHTVLNKTTEFLINYIREYKKIGANGVVIAEPLAGLLSPDFGAEFSAPYVKRIVDELQDDNFVVIYHNCGNSVVHMIDSIISTGATGFHFGNAINMIDILPLIPQHVLVLGNVDPAGEFRNGTTDSIRAVTRSLLEQCSSYPNFIISSGCDIPPLAKWENIDAFFDEVSSFYQR